MKNKCLIISHVNTNMQSDFRLVIFNLPSSDLKKTAFRKIAQNEHFHNLLNS